MDTIEKRYTFAEKLREALRHSDNYTESTDDDSYAVDISISGSRTDNDGIRYVYCVHWKLHCPFIECYFFFLLIFLFLFLFSLICSLFVYRIRRGGSRGFVLTEDSLDEEYFIQSLNQEQNWLEKFRSKFTNGKSITVCLHSRAFALLVNI